MPFWFHGIDEPLGFQKEWPLEAVWLNAQAGRRARQVHPGVPYGGVGGEDRVWTVWDKTHLYVSVLFPYLL